MQLQRLQSVWQHCWMDTYRDSSYYLSVKSFWFNQKQKSCSKRNLTLKSHNRHVVVVIDWDISHVWLKFPPSSSSKAITKVITIHLVENQNVFTKFLCNPSNRPVILRHFTKEKAWINHLGRMIWSEAQNYLSLHQVSVFIRYFARQEKHFTWWCC